MIDKDTQELEFAIEVGMRVVPHAGGYQLQRINGKGVTVSVTPTQEHAYHLWLNLYRTAQRLAAVLEGGEEGRPKSQQPKVA